MGKDCLESKLCWRTRSLQYKLYSW